MTTSSTSSSEPGPGARRRALARLPWAGVLAVALLLLVDRSLFGFPAVWRWLPVDDPNSAAAMRLELLALHDAPPERPRVIVVGTSRVIDGFDKKLAERLLPGVAFAKLGYPRFEPFAIRSLVPELLAARPTAVCLIASEQDTHRPLRLEPVPGSSTANLGALLELLGMTSWRFALEQRLAFYRLVASRALELYRFRPDFLLTALGKAREFAMDDRLVDQRPREDPFRPAALWGAKRRPVPEAAQRSTWDLFPPLMDQWSARIQAGTVQEITPGAHVPVQMGLLEGAIRRLREAGVEVVIVQGVMHPAADDLFDTALVATFLAFARRLVEEHGVVFVSRDEMQPFAESDFYDLVHTVARGARKITRGMIAGLRATPVDWDARGP
ncbi:MAG: hypothetical protein QNK04_29310 [Myxococcota bacterium]|nr:hypothetical protein [Myxococcota bacterium]